MFDLGYNPMEHDYYIDFAYQARICEAEYRWERALEMFPATCTVCECGNVTPDEKWAWCELREEWVGGDLKCIDPTVDFEPTLEWEGHQAETLAA